MIEWRSFSQEAMDPCWKNLAEKMEEVVLDKKEVEECKRGANRGRGSTLEWRRVRRIKKFRKRMWREDCWARIIALFREYNLQCLQSMNEDCTEEEEMRSQQRMKLMKDITKKIRSRGWMDAKNRWWFADLLAANCEKAWPHSVEETKMQGWFSWLEDLKKKDEKKQMEQMHQQQASQMVKKAEGSAGLLHKITKPAAWRGGAQILEKKEDAGLIGEENRIGKTQAV